MVWYVYVCMYVCMYIMLFIRTYFRKNNFIVYKKENTYIFIIKFIFQMHLIYVL